MEQQQVAPSPAQSEASTAEGGAETEGVVPSLAPVPEPMVGAATKPPIDVAPELAAGAVAESMAGAVAESMAGAAVESIAGAAVVPSLAPVLEPLVAAAAKPVLEVTTEPAPEAAADPERTPPLTLSPLVEAVREPVETPLRPLRIALPTHCSGCSVQKTDAPRCDHCGAALRAGGYVVLRTISQGPHGRVYEALGPNGKVVALKELIFSLVPDAATLDAFEREAELLRSISHAQIPRLLDAFSEGVGVHTRLYLAQEFVDGESLLHSIEREPLSELEALRLAKQVLRVLKALHGRDPPVLHRDIKPANLILRPDGLVSLVDFGSARLLARDVTHGATLVGTFGYMPPEQLGGTVDASCDLYALGATLMHGLAGRRPDEMTRDGLKLDVEGHLRHVSPWLRKQIKRLVAPHRGARFRDAEEALDAFANPRLGIPWRHMALGAGLVGALGVVGIVSGAAVGALWPPSPRSAPVRAAPAPRESRQGMGQLVYTTAEAGLEVHLNGVPTGRVTPIPATQPLQVPSGAHAITLMKGGRAVSRQVVTVAPGELVHLGDLPPD